MTKLKKRLLLAVTLVCSFFALAACSETKIADKPENSAVYDQAKVLSKVTRYFIDGGSKSGSTNGRINILVLDENRYEIKQGYLDKDGYHSY